MAVHVVNHDTGAAGVVGANAVRPYSGAASAWPEHAPSSGIEIVRGVRGDAARVHTAGETTLGAWRDFLNRADYPCHYVSPEFFDEKRFAAQDPFALLVWQDGRIAAVASGMRDGRTVQCGLSSRPQLSIDPAANRSRVAQALVDGFGQVHRDAQRVSVVSWGALPELTAGGYREHVHSGDGCVVLLDLRRGPDALFKEFSESRRANVRKAIRRGIEVAEARTDEEIATYYDIYVEWSTRKEQPILEFPLFRDTMLARNNRRLFLARYDGVIIAGVVVRFQPGGVVEYAANSSRKADQSLRPNDLLHWRVIEWACAQGFTTYSLGGAHLFLRRFGGTIASTFEYRLDRTFGKRLEMREKLVDAARWSWHHLPQPLKSRLRGGSEGNGE